MGPSRRSIWASLLFSGTAVALGVVRVATDGSGAVTLVLVWLLAIAIVAVLCIGLTRFYNSRMSRAVASAPPGAWSSKCVLPATPQAWRAVIVDDAGISIVNARGRSGASWRWDQVDQVRQDSLLTGLVHHEGLTLTTGTGESVALLFPSRSTLAYPRDLLETAKGEIERRLRAAVPPR
jgi:hypothetical protein